MSHNNNGNLKLQYLPSPLVKSPPWSIKSLITRWNFDPLYPSPFGFLASSTKFSTVFGTELPNRPISIRPASSPPIVISKNTFLVTFGPLVSFPSASKGSNEYRRNITEPTINNFIANFKIEWGARPPLEAKKSWRSVIKLGLARTRLLNV